MGIIANLLAVTKPTGFWQTMIFGLNNSVLSYVLTILIITVSIKFILMPLEFLNRFYQSKNQVLMTKQKDELENIKKKYAKNPKILALKEAEYNKKQQQNVKGASGMCLTTLLYIVASSVIFMTFFTAINSVTSYNLKNQYDVLKTEYYAEFNKVASDEILVGKTDEEQKELKTLAQEKAEKAVAKKYPSTRESFLWIKNIWLPDKNVSEIPSFAEYNKIVNISTKGKTKEEAKLFLQEQEKEYNKIMGNLKNVYKGNNGCYGLIIIMSIFSFLSVQLPIWINKFKENKKKKKLETEIIKVGEEQTAELPQHSNVVMSIIMIFIMVLIAMFYNSLFTIYMLIQSFVSFLLNPLYSLLINKLNNRKNKNKKDDNKVSYSKY